MEKTKDAATSLEHILFYNYRLGMDYWMSQLTDFLSLNYVPHSAVHDIFTQIILIPQSHHLSTDTKREEFE